MLDRYHHIFIVGIKGAAMANIAVLLKKMGKHVSGSDVSEQFITDQILKGDDISVFSGFQTKDIPLLTDLVIYSGANEGYNNPQVKQAVAQNIPVLSQAAFLGELMKEFEVKIAVAGCHGKTTTSSFLAYALFKLHQKPSYLVGVPSFGELPGASFEEKKYFVIEADEYAVNPPQDKTPKFHFLSPQWIICTNIDFDHPDIYKDLEDTKAAFLKFFDDKKLILCRDDEAIASLLPHLSKQTMLTYGFHPESDLQIVNDTYTDQKSMFEIQIKTSKQIGNFDQPSYRFDIKLPGKKNVSNATGMISQLLLLGFHPHDIQRAIQGFDGAKRRFELVYRDDSFMVYDDYAHHPHEIEATIEATRNRFPNKRILVVFQPHTFSRTHALLNQFASALSKADAAFILPIFASAREKSADFPVTSIDIQKAAQHLLTGSVNAYEGKTQLLQALEAVLQPNDVLFTVGAGDVYRLKDDIIKIIKSYESNTPSSGVDSNRSDKRTV